MAQVRMCWSNSDAGSSLTRSIRKHKKHIRIDAFTRRVSKLKYASLTLTLRQPYAAEITALSGLNLASPKIAIAEKSLHFQVAKCNVASSTEEIADKSPEDRNFLGCRMKIGVPLRLRNPLLTFSLLIIEDFWVRLSFLSDRNALVPRNVLKRLRLLGKSRETGNPHQKEGKGEQQGSSVFGTLSP